MTGALDRDALDAADVVVIGCGGLGSPASDVLARSGRVKRMTLVDDDTIDVTNLHRQTLYEEGDVGRDKARTAAVRLRERVGVDASITLDALRTRLRPDTADAIFRGRTLVIEGADNFATKFLTADAARLTGAGVAVAHAGAVRWHGWAMLSARDAGSGPCLRCVFEDIPRDRVETCATAGVIGPVVGVVAALQASLALAHLAGDPRAVGTVFHYDGLAGRVRRFRATRRDDCPLCSGEVRDLAPERYLADCNAA